MKFFKEKNNKFFAKKTIYGCGIKIETDNHVDLLSACLGRVMANQLALFEQVVDGNDYDINVSKGTITFGNITYPVQFLGSESEAAKTWLWGWRNINKYPEKVLKSVNALRNIGQEANIYALTTPQFNTSNNYNGDAMAAIACGLSEENICYFKASYNGGSAFFLISKVPNEIFAPVNSIRFIDITMRLLPEYRLNHKIFVQSFLYQNDTPFECDCSQENHKIVAHFLNGQDIEIVFEQVGTEYKIIQLNNI